MTRTVAERLRERGLPITPLQKQREAASQRRRTKRPVPATRSEAEELFRPRILAAHGGWLMRMNRLGLLHPDRRPITAQEAHEAILDAMYDENGNLRVDMTDAAEAPSVPQSVD